MPEPVAVVRRAVREALPAPSAAPGGLVVACSGGADSLALAAAAAHVGAERGIAVHGVVVDHGLQPGSAAQARATEAVLGTLGLTAGVAAVEVGADGGPEAAARTARYAALRAVSRARGDAPVLLGHTLDDQAETVLLGLGRGSGARSLAGMTGWDPPWCRPLLDVRRATTRAACDAAGLTPWEDPHNADARFTRVRLRHEVLPLLEDVLAGGVAAALARTAAQLADDETALTDLARAREAEVAAADGSLDARALALEPPAVRRRVLRSWLVTAGIGAPTDAHLRAVDALVGAWRGQGAPPLPGGLVVVRRHGRLRVIEAPAPSAPS